MVTTTKKECSFGPDQKILHLTPLQECNENCLFCVRRGDSPPLKFLTTRELTRIFKEKKKDGFKTIMLDGGEPTLRKDLILLIKFARRIGYSEFQILTNAVLLADRKLVKNILETATKNFRLVFSVSLHSHRKATSEKLVRTSNTFEKTIQGIRNLVKYAYKKNTLIGLYHLINKYNYRNLPAFVNFIRKEFPAIKSITFSFVYPTGEVLKNKFIVPKFSDVKPHLLMALSLCKKHKIKFDFSNCGFVPFCFIRGYEELFIGHQDFDQSGKRWVVDSVQDQAYYLASKKFRTEDNLLLKIPGCSKCIFNNYCPGLWKVYAELYGTSELKPILK